MSAQLPELYTLRTLIISQFFNKNFFNLIFVFKESWHDLEKYPFNNNSLIQQSILTIPLSIVVNFLQIWHSVNLFDVLKIA